MAKIKLKSLAYASIKDKIISCQYAPGCTLSEEHLCAELKISRTPVRDALGRLEQEGLLIIRPKVGITVKPLTINDITMCFEVRMLYEPHILKHYGTMLDEQDLGHYYQIFSQPEKEKKQYTDSEYYQLDTEFHQLVLNVCPNHYMKRRYLLIETQSERFRYMTGRISSERLRQTFTEHCDILTACLQKDWDKASEHMLNHLQESKKNTFLLAFNNMIQV